MNLTTENRFRQLFNECRTLQMMLTGSFVANKVTWILVKERIFLDVAFRAKFESNWSLQESWLPILNELHISIYGLKWQGERIPLDDFTSGVSSYQSVLEGAQGGKGNYDISEKYYERCLGYLALPSKSQFLHEFNLIVAQYIASEETEAG